MTTRFSKHRSVVAHYGARYESLLRNTLAVDQTVSFRDMLLRTQAWLGGRLTKLLFDFKETRNGFLHNSETNTLNDVDSFIANINEIEERLSKRISTLVMEPLHAEELHQDIPHQETVYVEVPVYQPQPPNKLFWWGVALIAFGLFCGVIFSFTGVTTTTTEWTERKWLGLVKIVHTHTYENHVFTLWFYVVIVGFITGAFGAAQMIRDYFRHAKKIA